MAQWRFRNGGLARGESARDGLLYASGGVCLWIASFVTWKPNAPFCRCSQKDSTDLVSVASSHEHQCNHVCMRAVRSYDPGVTWYPSLPAGHVTEVVGVLGRQVDLPCDTSSTDRSDQATLVLWYKDDDGTPLYR